jgi:hypothetical protein
MWFTVFLCLFRLYKYEFICLCFIADAELLSVMNKVKHDRSFYVVMDFCFSGGIFKGLAKEQLKPYIENPKSNKSFSSNAIMITATRRTRYAWTEFFRKGGKLRGLQYNCLLRKFKQKYRMKRMSWYIGWRKVLCLLKHSVKLQRNLMVTGRLTILLKHRGDNSD